MSVHAYMFVETTVDPVQFAVAARKVGGVIAAHGLFGPLDAIVAIEVDDLPELERVVGEVHRLPGLKSGDTRIARSP